MEMLGDGCDAALPVEQRGEVGALESGGAHQHEPRIEFGGRHSDLGVRGHDHLLGEGDIRPTDQELGG